MLFLLTLPASFAAGFLGYPFLSSVLVLAIINLIDMYFITPRFHKGLAASLKVQHDEGIVLRILFQMFVFWGAIIAIVFFIGSLFS